MIRRELTLLAVAAILVSMTVPSVLACKTWTPGYWKNDRKHPWPTDTITLGVTVYTQTEALGILRTPPKEGNAWIILAQKVIAGKLSMLADPGPHWGVITFTQLIADADAWFVANPNPESYSDRATAIELAEAIDDVLNNPEYHQD